MLSKILCGLHPNHSMAQEKLQPQSLYRFVNPLNALICHAVFKVLIYQKYVL